MRKALLVSLLIGVAAPALAETVPKPMRVDARSTTALYQEGQVYKIYTRLKRVTLIKLAQGERFVDFKAGDTESFLFSDTDAGNAILVKPVIAGAVTNGVIVTNRRFYLVELHKSSKRRPHYAVNFHAPQSQRSTASTSAPRGVPRKYVLSAQTKGAQIAPIKVWDDGQKTYFEFGPDAPIPSIYRADSRGREYLVNGRTNGRRLTVGRRSDRWVIRYGDEYVCIQNKELGDG